MASTTQENFNKLFQEIGHMSGKLESLPKIEKHLEKQNNKIFKMMEQVVANTEGRKNVKRLFFVSVVILSSILGYMFNLIT